MALDALPVWSIRPDWADPVTEFLEWQTAVLQSPTGAEQRFGLRIAPRRLYEYGVTLFGTERARAVNLIHGVGRGEWWTPLWHDAVKLTADSPDGDTSISCATADTELRVGAALIFGRSMHDFDLVEITAVSGGGVTIAAPGVTRDWPAVSTRICPARRGRMMQQTGLTRAADRAGQGRVMFQITEPDDVSGGTFPEYLDRIVVLTPPNEAENLAIDFDRLASIFDDGIAPPVVRDPGNIGQIVQAHDWTLTGRAERMAFRRLLYALAGRRVTAWLPTFSADLEPVAALSGTDLTVRKCGYAYSGGPSSGREYIQVHKRDGSYFRARVLDATEGEDTETLTIDEAPPSAIDPADVRRVSFLMPCRLDEDRIQIDHITDSVSTCAAAFRSVALTRDATPWEPAMPDNTAYDTLPCGEEPSIRAPRVRWHMGPLTTLQTTSSLDIWTSTGFSLPELGQTIAPGDVILLVCVAIGNRTFTVPEGFASYIRRTDVGRTFELFWKRATGDEDTTPFVVSIVGGLALGSQAWNPHVTVMRDVVASGSPFRGTPVIETGEGSYTSPSFTTTEANVAVFDLNIVQNGAEYAPPYRRDVLTGSEWFGFVVAGPVTVFVSGFDTQTTGSQGYIRTGVGVPALVVPESEVTITTDSAVPAEYPKGDWLHVMFGMKGV